MVEIMETVTGIFLLIVKTIANFANAFGGPFINWLHTLWPAVPNDPTLGTTLIILISGGVVFKLVESGPIKYGLLIILGAVLLTTFGAGTI